MLSHFSLIIATLLKGILNLARKWTVFFVKTPDRLPLLGPEGAES